MGIHMNQKATDKRSRVPMLWRDCAWRIRIFVRTRIGGRRPLAAGGGLLVGREVPGLPGLTIWNATPLRWCHRRLVATPSHARNAASSLQHPRGAHGLAHEIGSSPRDVL